MTPPIESLTLFGSSPIDRLMRRAGLGGASLRSATRRAATWAAATWLPLLALSLLESPSGMEIRFIDDFAVHARLLLAMPILIGFEGFAQARLAGVVPTLLERGMIPDRSSTRLAAIVRRIGTTAGSGAGEALILGFSIAFVQRLSFVDLPEGVISWKTGTWAQAWYEWVSLVAYHFVLFRWFWRYFLWSGFLVALAVEGPEAQSHHPDKFGGLSFLPARHLVFGPISLAISIVLSSNIAEVVLYGGEHLDRFRSPVLAYFAVVGLAYAFPLLAFTPLLIRTKRQGYRTYGTFASRHAVDFENRWRGTAVGHGPSPLGHADISANNDLDGSYEHLVAMSVVLLSRKQVMGLAAFTAGPLIPLALLKMPVVDLLQDLLKLVS